MAKLLPFMLYMLLVTVSFSLPYSKEYTANIYYSQSGKKCHHLGKLTLNIDNLALYPNKYTVNFKSIMCCQGFVSIGDFQHSLSAQAISISVGNIQFDYYWQTSLTFSVFTNSPNLISKLSVSYFAPWNYLSIYSYDNYVINSYISNNPSTFKAIPLSGVYYDESIKAITVLNGFSVNSTDSSNTFSVALSVGVSATRNIQIQVSSKSPIPTYIQAISFTVFRHWFSVQPSNNRALIIYSQSLSFYGTNNAKYTDNRHTIMDFNTFVGLTSFHISSQNTFSFSTSIDQNTISLTSSNTFSQLTLTYFIAYSKYCPYNSPYRGYWEYSYLWRGLVQKCFDVCPEGTHIDYNHLYCYCNYDECLFTVKQLQQKEGSLWNYWKLIGFSVFAPMIAAILLLLLICACLKQYKNRQRHSQQVGANQRKGIQVQRPSTVELKQDSATLQLED